jgi:hypothetical protein
MDLYTESIRHLSLGERLELIQTMSKSLYRIPRLRKQSVGETKC